VSQVEIAGTAATPSAVASPDDRLVLTGVTKRWRRGDPLVLDGIDLELPAGALAVVVGRNGSGKTTLLRIVAGMIAPEAGTVRLDGLTARRQRRSYSRRVGLLSAASTGLYARFSVAQHLEYWARLAFVPPGERRAAIADALARFELESVAGRRAERISMGQRQRLRLALTVVHRPSLLLLDEPWNSLDGEGIELVNETIAGFVQAGGKALMCVPTGHELDGLPAHRTCVLEAGRLSSP
jgi:ABC-2 type transport system ATP-binding protein